MEKISVLVPVYNVKNYLWQCLDSLRSQSIKEIEIICVDDGSTDGSEILLDSYAEADSRIKVIHKENTGYGHSMNVALEHAVGEYIAVVESDDFVEPDMLEKLYEAAVMSGAEVIKADHYDYCKGSSRRREYLHAYPKKRLINASDCPALLNLADTIWSCLYQKEFLMWHRIRFHETSGASFQDISFSLQVWLNAEKVYFIPDAVLHYRNDNPDSSMHNPAKIFCVFEEYEWLEEMFLDLWQRKPGLEKYFVGTKYRDYFNHYARVAAPYQYAFLLKLVESLKEDRRKGRVEEAAFLPGVWRNVCTVLEDVNHFFLATGKGSQDMRLEFCKFENEEFYEEAFVEHMKDFPQVVVYGAGKVGQKLAGVLRKKGLTITCFTVTETGKEKTELLGIPIYELKDIKEMADSCAVVVAVAEHSQYELYRNLEKYGFRHVFRVDEIVRKMISSIV